MTARSSEETKSSGKRVVLNLCSSHKVILASGSEYFMEIFRSMGKNVPSPLKIPDPAPLDKFQVMADDAFSTIIKYLYGAQVSPNF